MLPEEYVGIWGPFIKYECRYTPGDAPETLRDFIGTIRADTPFRAVSVSSVDLLKTWIAAEQGKQREWVTVCRRRRRSSHRRCCHC